MSAGLLALWLAPACGAASLLGFTGWAFPGNRRLARVGEGAGLAAGALTLAAWGLRWHAAGHLPLFGTYESSLSLAAAVLLSVALLRLATRRAERVWPAACLVAAAVVAHGARFDPTPFPLTISERSWVVDVHALLAWGAFGVLAANVGLALWVLVSRRETGRGVLVSRRAADGAEDSGYDRTGRWLARTLTLGFALHTAMLASGSFYKFLLFGTAWSFDPVETLGFVTWLAYGTLLHLHLFAGWEGRRLAAWCLGLFLVLAVSYRGIVYFPAWSTYHIFDMDLRMHLTGGGPEP